MKPTVSCAMDDDERAAGATSAAAAARRASAAERLRQSAAVGWAPRRAERRGDNFSYGNTHYG